MTTRNWKPLTNVQTKYDPNELRLSLQRNGELAMSLAAFHALRSPAAIAMFYDETAGLIGIKPADPGSSSAIPLRKRERGQQRKASVRQFLTTFGLPKPASVIRFPKPTFDPDGTLVLNYREATEEETHGDAPV